MIFYHFCVFMKTVGVCTVLIADMNSACKNTLVNVYLQLTKINDFLLFLRFHENRRIMHGFHQRYEFCKQKYPSKCIFIEFP